MRRAGVENLPVYTEAIIKKTALLPKDIFRQYILHYHDDSCSGHKKKQSLILILTSNGCHPPVVAPLFFICTLLSIKPLTKVWPVFIPFEQHSIIQAQTGCICNFVSHAKNYFHTLSPLSNSHFYRIQKSSSRALQ